jgi:hypothetical protein
MIPDPEIFEKWGKLLWKLFLFAKPARRWWLRRRARFAQTAFRHPLLYHYLEWKYKPYKLFQYGSHKYPIIFFPIDDARTKEPNSVLVTPLISEATHEIVTENRVVYDLLYDLIGLKERDNQTYMLKDFNPESRTLTCWVERFSQSLKSSHSLEWELLGTVAKYPELTPEELDERLKLRKALHSIVSDPIVSGDGRAAAVATSILLLCSRGSDCVFWLKQRGTLSIPINVDQLHVIPGGMFQAASGFLDEEFDVIHNFKREYLEELFSRPDPSGTEAVPDYFYSELPLLYLQELFDRGQANLELLGIAVDLLNLRPEICMMLTIGTPEWVKKHGRDARDDKMKFRINSEFLPTLNDNYARTFVFPIPSDRVGELSPDKIAPPAAVCLWAAQERLLAKQKSTAAGWP